MLNFLYLLGTSLAIYSIIYLLKGIIKDLATNEYLDILPNTIMIVVLIIVGSNLFEKVIQLLR